MSFERSKLGSRIAQNLSANVLDQGVTLVIQLVGVPILLRAWGTQLYGEWLILFAIPAYLSMTDLGFSQSAGNDMTARVGRADKRGALIVFQSLAAMVYGMAGLGMALSAILFWFLPLQHWLHFRSMSATHVHWVLVLLSAEVCARLPNGVTHAGFRACGGYALHVAMDSATRFLQFSAIWLVALAGGGPVAAAAGYFGIRAIATPTAALLLVVRYRWMRFGLRHASLAELRQLVKPALANMAIPTAQALNIQGMVLVVGAVLGPLAVVVFSTLRTLTRLALQLVLAVSHAAEPEIAAAYGAGDLALMESLFVHTLRAALWAALAAAAVLATLGTYIVRVWTHSKVVMNAGLFGWLLASAVAGVLWYSGLILLKAANEHARAATVYVLASALAVGSGMLLLSLTGNVANAGLALLLMDGVMAVYSLQASAALLDVHPTASLRRAANPWPLLDIARRRAITGL